MERPYCGLPIKKTSVIAPYCLILIKILPSKSDYYYF